MLTQLRTTEWASILKMVSSGIFSFTFSQMYRQQVATTPITERAAQVMSRI
ncbi:hypothetical protein D3C73_1513150 [compost metagenome]